MCHSTHYIYFVVSVLGHCCHAHIKPRGCWRWEFCTSVIRIMCESNAVTGHDSTAKTVNMNDFVWICRVCTTSRTVFYDSDFMSFFTPGSEWSISWYFHLHLLS